MPHGNAPLTPEGRLRLVQRIDEGRPISHVAQEAGVSRQRLSVWYQRWLDDGEEGLEDRSSRPHTSPNQTDEIIEDKVEEMRRRTRWGPMRISGTLAMEGIFVSAATVHRILQRRGISRRRDLDPTGNTMRKVVTRYEMANPGDRVHIDVKKVGKIPEGGGWWLHGQGSKAHLQSRRVGYVRPGYTFIHAAIDACSRIAFTDCMEDEKAISAVEFMERALIFFASHGILVVKSIMTDNGSCYRSRLYNATLEERSIVHFYTRPHRPQTNGKVERFNQTMQEEWLRATGFTSEEERRAAMIPFLNDYNHDRPHSSVGNKPPISRAPMPGQRLVPGLVVLPERPRVDQQLSLDLMADRDPRE